MVMVTIQMAEEEDQKCTHRFSGHFGGLVVVAAPGVLVGHPEKVRDRRVLPGLLRSTSATTRANARLAAGMRLLERRRSCHYHCESVNKLLSVVGHIQPDSTGALVLLLTQLYFHY